MSTIAENVAHVRERIAAAAVRVGRSPDEIRLVGVSKYVSGERSAELVRAGCLELGESRPQQLWDKATDAAFTGLHVRWHMIGHLQRNKVARTLPLAAMIHSVDSPRLLKAIDDAASNQKLRPQVLLEVNCSGEAEKHGFTADGLRELLPQLVRYPAVEIRGLMTMAAGDGNLATAAKNFAALRELQAELRPQLPSGIELPELSMGMSHDFEVAIAEGRDHRAGGIGTVARCRMRPFAVE